MGRRLLPLRWERDDVCDVRGARGVVRQLSGDDALVEVDGLPFWVPSSALELVALPEGAS